MPLSFELRFHPSELVYPTTPSCSRVIGTSCENPYYISYGQAKIGGAMYRLETYSWYYTCNPAIGCGACLCPTNEFLGYHDHDVERITAAYVIGDAASKHPSMIYYGAHGKGQGVWVPWKEVPKTSDGNVIVYVARGGHGSYHNPGVKWRIFGFANDKCSNSGKHKLYDSNKDLLTAFDMVFPNGIAMRKAIDIPPHSSIRWWQRLFLPLWKP